MGERKSPDVRGRWLRVKDTAFGAFFLFLLLLPGTRALVSGSSFQPTIEKRAPAAFPRLEWASLATFPARFDEAFDDRFGFRNELVRAASLAKVSLGVSPSPKVIIGREGWLFYSAELELEQFRRLTRFSRPELEALRSAFEKRRSWLACRGIHYLLVVPPNKDGVYPEYMPGELNRLGQPSRFEQLTHALDQRSGVDYVDLHDTFQEMKRTDLLYDRTDTHWNGLGAFLAYQQIATRLGSWFPVIHPMDRSATTEERISRPGGDLSGMLALSAVLIEREHVDVKPRRRRAVPASPQVPFPAELPVFARPSATEISDPELPRALVLRDSFGELLMPFLSEHFSRIVYVSTHEFPLDVIERERPDVVIDELVERYLMRGPPPNPPLRGACTTAPPGRPLHMDEPHPAGVLMPGVLSAEKHDVRDTLGGFLEAVGPDPFVVLRALPFEAEPHQHAWVKMAAIPPPDGSGDGDGGAIAQLFWAAPDGDFDERVCVRFPILLDGRVHEYAIPLGLTHAWKGLVENLRLDLVDAMPGAIYDLRSLQIER
jgi:hypothetical protein